MTLYKIIVADDEPMILNGLVNNVPWQELGFELVAACEDGGQVLDLTRRTHVDAVLADIRMPDCSGIEIAQTLQIENPSVYVLFLTAYSDFDYAQAAIKCGVWRYMVKPIKFAKLLETLRELHLALQHHNLERKTDPENKDSDPLIEIVEEYIQCHFGNASLSEIAEKLDLTPAYLSRIFYQRRGIHFSNRLQDVRMREAAKLLKSTKYRVGEISEIVGYSSPKNFTRSFQKQIGMTPRDYRISGI